MRKRKPKLKKRRNLKKKRKKRKRRRKKKKTEKEQFSKKEKIEYLLRWPRGQTAQLTCHQTLKKMTISLENDDNCDDDIVSHCAAIPQLQHPWNTIGGKRPRNWSFSSYQESPTFGSRNQPTNFSNFHVKVGDSMKDLTLVARDHGS